LHSFPTRRSSDLQFFVSVSAVNQKINKGKNRENNPSIMHGFAEIEKRQCQQRRNAKPQKFEQQNAFVWPEKLCGKGKILLINYPKNLMCFGTIGTGNNHAFFLFGIVF